MPEQQELPGFPSPPDPPSDCLGAFALAADLRRLGVANSAIQELCSLTLLCQWAIEYNADLRSGELRELIRAHLQLGARGQQRPVVAHRELLDILAAKLRLGEVSADQPLQIEPAGALEIFRDGATFSEALLRLRAELVTRSEAPDALYAHCFGALAEVLQRVSTIGSEPFAKLAQWRARLPERRVKTDTDLLGCLEEVLRAADCRSSFLCADWLLSVVSAVCKTPAMEGTVDPAIGSSHFLVLSDPAIVPALLPVDAAGASEHLRIDYDARDVVIGLTRFVLQQDREQRLLKQILRMRDTLVKPRLEHAVGRGPFDLMLINSPFGGRVVKEFRRGRWVSVRDPERLFITRALGNLAPDGRAGIIVPTGFLCRSDRTSTEFRRELIEQGALEAVVSLPSDVFSNAPNVSAAILLLRARNAPVSEQQTTRSPNPAMLKSILMVDGATLLGSVKGGAPSSESVAQLLALLRAGPPVNTASAAASSANSPGATVSPESSSTGQFWTLSAAELKKRHWDLSVAPLELPEPDWLATSWGQELQKRGCVRALNDHVVVRGGYYAEDAVLADKAAAEGGVGYFRIHDLSNGLAQWPSRWVIPEEARVIPKRHLLQPGDLLLSRSGTIGKVAVVDAEVPPAVVCLGLYVLNADTERLNPDFLVGYLESDATRAWLKAHAARTVQGNFTLETLRSLKIPVPDLDVQAKVVAESRATGAGLLDCLAAATSASTE